MAEERVKMRDVDLRELFPWLALFRTFGLAIDFKKLVLAGLGILFMTSGWWGLALAFTRAAPQNTALRHEAEAITGIRTDSDAGFPWAGPGRWQAPRVDGTTGGHGVKELWASPLERLLNLARHFVLRPVEDLVLPFGSLFAGSSQSSSAFVTTVFVFVCAIWALVVWAIFGGAITRIAAVQFARDERISLREALSFSRTKFLSFLGGPLFPLVLVAVIVVFCAAGGAMSAIPWFGPVFAGTLWILPLIAGFCMAFLLLGLAVGWPLMFATVSVEGSDTFDAMSRTYAYVIQRPWHYLFYALTAVVYGSICSLFVLLFADLLVHFAGWAVQFGYAWRGGELISQLAYYAPWGSGWRPDEQVAEPEGVVRFAAWFAAFWLHGAFLLVAGFAYSYFWSASTIIYYLLRRDVDSIELEEVYLEGSEQELDLQPSAPAGSGESASAGGGAESGESAQPTEQPQSKPETDQA